MGLRSSDDHGRSGSMQRMQHAETLSTQITIASPKRISASRKPGYLSMRRIHSSPPGANRRRRRGSRPPPPRRRPPIASSASSVLVCSAILFLIHCIALASGNASEDGGLVVTPDGGCHRSVSTKPVLNTISANGIVFAIRSDVANEDELVITSFGFHVEAQCLVNNGTKIEYELYVLKHTGYYASPERNPQATMMISADADPNFDYRGDVEESWDLIAEGQIRQGDLTYTNTTLSITEADFFQIPLGSFAGVVVPATGGVRSFYIATKSGCFIYADSEEGFDPDEEGYAVNDETRLAGGDGDDPREPEVLVGEGVVGYPMTDCPLYYQTNSFVGTVYYEAVCPSEAPSISAQPSGQPNVPSQRPSAHPSIQPSGPPSLVPVFGSTISGSGTTEGSASGTTAGTTAGSASGTKTGSDSDTVESGSSDSSGGTASDNSTGGSVGDDLDPDSNGAAVENRSSVAAVILCMVGLMCGIANF